MKNFDVIVIGGGHAGTEAAHAAAMMGCSTALVTLRKDRIGLMSCNPAMGGLAKGQLIKEIDALGGIMGRNTDDTAIQYRVLNESKGPAVRSSRAQCDKALYAYRMQERLTGVKGLTLLEAEVDELLLQGNQVKGVRLKEGTELLAPSVVVTSGTFMKAVMFTGEERSQGGRVGDNASLGLSDSLREMGFRLTRLKTGTPPRLKRSSIPFERLEEQKGDAQPRAFSFFPRLGQFPRLPQVSCFITYTNEKTHQIIEKNFERSPMFSGAIQGVGPRYCPSIEDKVKRFRDKERHQIFLEPEGLDVEEIYVNGISTSLPRDVQEAFVHSIEGLEKAEFLRFGYAVEYDAIDARQLKLSLESKDWKGLFFAGQVNGTSGYEEAGAQGLVAGVNAARLILEKDPVTLGRDQAYIGVLIDDLVTKGTDEPYRMFTSRAEHRLLLREDNADARLTPLGRELGLISDEDYSWFETKRAQVESGRALLKEKAALPSGAVQEWLRAKGLPELKDKVSLEVFLRRPEVKVETLVELGLLEWQVEPSVREQVEIQVKYEGYIKRELELFDGVKKSEAFRIPSHFDYGQVAGLSNEVRSRLSLARPENLGQVSRLPGITPAAVANLLIHLKTHSLGKGA